MDQETNSLIDINQADEETLTQLRGVGSRLAKRVIAARPFESIDDLTRVRGISTKDVERLSPFVTVAKTSASSEDIEEASIEAGSEESEVPETVETEVETEVSGEAVTEADVVPQGIEAEEATAEIAVTETLVPLPEIEEEDEISADSPAEEDEIEAEKEPDQPVEAEEIEAPSEKEKIEEAETDLASEELEPTDEEYIEAEPVVEQPHKRQPAYLTRGGAFGLFVFTFIFSVILAVAITLGILSSMNRGGLTFASPGQVTALRNQLEGVSAQILIVAEDLDSLRTRMDNLEALSGRVNAVESEIENLQSEILTLQSDIDTTQAQYDELTTQIEDIDVQLETLAEQNNRFEGFLEGLRDLLSSLFPEEQE